MTGREDGSIELLRADETGFCRARIFPFL